MFGIGMPEMLLLLAVALIVFGPKKLPDLAKSLGRALGEFKRATSDLKDSIESETGISEVRDTFKDVTKEINTPVDLAGDIPDPDPAPADGKDDATAKQADDASGKDAPDAPMSKVKAAFDELNTDDKDPSAEFSRTGDSSPSDDQDTKARDDAS